MKKIILLICFFINSALASEFQVDVHANQNEKMNLLIGLVGESQKELRKIAEIVKSDFEFGSQFNVFIQEINLKSKKDLMDFDHKGYPLIIFLSKDKKIININDINGINSINWRLYDSNQASMIKGKKVYRVGNNNLFNLAHVLSDQIWHELTGEPGCFSSVIAAFKKVNIKKNKYITNIYVFHPMEFFNQLSSPKLIVNENTIFIAPRWNPKKPIFYYSKHTPYNVRLMSLDSSMIKRTVSNFDGLNMSPTFSDEGKIALSLTRNGKGELHAYEFDAVNKTGRFTHLTSHAMHAISPIYINEDQIVFCAINADNTPKIAIYNTTNKNIEYLTNSGHCVSPAYCKRSNKLAYCKKVDKFLQIFLYDFNSKEHEQITFDDGDKDCCSWSGCGNYLVYSVENGKNSRIAILNILTTVQKYITPENEHWSSPSWSPVYAEVPFLYNN